MLCTLTTLKSVCTLRSVFLIGTMPITLPRREKAAPQVGQPLDISPIDLGEHLKSQHGLSSLLLAAESWEHFCWKGNDLSAPLRADSSGHAIAARCAYRAPPGGARA